MRWLVSLREFRDRCSENNDTQEHTFFLKHVLLIGWPREQRAGTKDVRLPRNLIFNYMPPYLQQYCPINLHWALAEKSNLNNKSATIGGNEKYE